MNIGRRLSNIEKAFSKTYNPLTEQDRIQVIDLSYQPLREREEINTYLNAEKEKRLTELRERLGNFSEDSIMWIIINPFG